MTEDQTSRAELSVEEFWAAAPPMRADLQERVRITLRVSAKVLDFFRRSETGYQMRINQTLEFFVCEQTRRKASGEPLWVFENARRALPGTERVAITLRVKRYVVDLFRDNGRGYQMRMHEALESFADYHSQRGQEAASG